MMRLRLQAGYTLQNYTMDKYTLEIEVWKLLVNGHSIQKMYDIQWSTDAL